VRPTGDAAYRDGTGTFHPAQRRVVDGADLHGDTTIAVDACVIGAGAGGAVAAKELAEGGMRGCTATPARSPRSGARRSCCRWARRWAVPR